MKIELHKTPENIDLVNRLCSDNRQESITAQEMLCQLIVPIGELYLETNSNIRNVYQDLNFDEGERPSIPVDPYCDTEHTDGISDSAHQTVSGGLPTNILTKAKELIISTFDLDSSVLFPREELRTKGLDFLSEKIEELFNELSIKDTRNGWAVMLFVLANAKNHMIRSSVKSALQPNDLNSLVKLTKGFQPKNSLPLLDNFSVTDIFVSEKQMRNIRAFTYNPLKEENREAIFKGCGEAIFEEIKITEVKELGIDEKYNYLFEIFGGELNSKEDELILGSSSKVKSAYRVVQVDKNGNKVQVLPDDQFISNLTDIGLYSCVTEGLVSLDKRQFSGIIV